MHERLLPASPNWYCSRCSDTNAKGVLGFGARNSIYLVQVTASSPLTLGELSGHKERVSGFVFSPHPGEEHTCASTSDDKTVKIWDIEKKVVISEHNAHEHTITAVDWSPREKTLVVTGDEKGVVMCFWHNTINIHSFMPQPRAIFCLSCSPHSDNLVAIGYKDGLVAVIDISKKGSMIHRLRGHDDEIHSLAWCPLPGERSLYSRTEDAGDAGADWRADAGVCGAEAGEAGCYLVSGSKDQTVRVWSTAKGKGIMTLKLPFLKRRGAAVDPGVKERIWLTVHWPKGMPTHVVSSCFGGELVLWDLSKSDKQKWTLLGSSADGQNHSRIVFNLSSAVVDDSELLISTSMDREVKCWSLSSLECCWSLPTLGGFVYALHFSPVASGLLAVGVGDNMIRLWNTLSLQRKYDSRVFWQGIRSKVTALAWHPGKESHLAFGTDDGKVAVYDVFSNKPPQSSSTYHKKTVYTLAWGPPVQPLSFGGGDKPSYSLFSCGGEGLIFQHDPWKLTGDASNIDKLICDTNQIKHKLSPHTDFSWKPDGKVLAIGNEDGSIGVFAAPNLKQLCSIEQHHKIINTLRWHHAHGSSPDLHALLASGSSNAIVYVHNLHSAIGSAGDSSVTITEAFRSLEGHTAKITSLDWSPHHDARLVTVCYDGTAQVWDVMKDEAVRNYRGHRGRLLCVQWSPVEPELVWTGGDDFTVHEWNVSKQEHSKPPKGKRAQQFKAKLKKKKKLTGKGGMRIEGNEEERGGGGGGGGEEEEEEKGTKLIGAVEEREEPEVTPPSNGEREEEEEEEERSSVSTPLTPAVPEWRRGPSSQSYVSAFTPDRLQNGDKMAASARKDDRRKDKPESALKRKKQRSLLPLSTSMDHRPKDDLLKDCVTLATHTHAPEEVVHCVAGSGEHIQFGLFSDRDALHRMLDEEERSHIEGGHYESMFNLRLWRGQEVEALKLAMEKGELNDYLISVAPMAGFRVWFEAVEAYVKQLVRQDQHLKAAAHLLSLGKFYEAVNLLKANNFYREAIAMAKARLRPDDPVLVDLYMTWAEQLEKDGHYTSGAKCYLAVGRDFDAAKIIGRKGDAASLRAAATLARVSGHRELSRSFSLRCAKDLATAQDWREAQEVLLQENLLTHRLLYSVNEMLVTHLAPVGVVTWSPASTHDWSIPCANDFLRAVEGVWQQEFAISASSPDRLRAALEELAGMDNPPTTTNMPLRQLLSQVAVDVSLGMLSWLLGDGDAALEHFLHAVVGGSEASSFTLMSETCTLLFPQGSASVSEYQSSSDEPSPVSRSLEAFICYQQLYRTWWACSGSTGPDSQSKVDPNGLHQQDSDHSTSGPNGCAENTDSASQNPEASELSKLLVAASRSLLSEPHAALQASQRAVSEVQRRVGCLVQRHSSGQDLGPSSGATEHTGTRTDTEHTGTRTDTEPQAQTQSPAPAPLPQQPSQEESACEESLPSLVASLAEHNKAIAEMPQHVKKFPFPRVVECCMLILYISQTPEITSTALRAEALSLLQKHGVWLQPAWKRFM